MVKIVGLNKIKKAAKWIAEQLCDDGFAPEYLVELGIRSELTLQAAIPTDALIHPKDGKSFGLNMVFLDGVVDLHPLDCRTLQAQGSINLYEVKSGGVLHQLNRAVTITYDDVRIRKDVLERYVEKHEERELSKQEHPENAPCRASEKAVPPVPVATPAPSVFRQQVSPNTNGWIESARRIADEVALKMWKAGALEISARSVCNKVANELAKNREWWGVRGPRSPSGVRNTALNGWKFTPPLSGLSGLNGLK